MSARAMWDDFVFPRNIRNHLHCHLWKPDALLPGRPAVVPAGPRRRRLDPERPKRTCREPFAASARGRASMLFFDPARWHLVIIWYPLCGSRFGTIDRLCLVHGFSFLFFSAAPWPVSCPPGPSPRRLRVAPALLPVPFFQVFLSLHLVLPDPMPPPAAWPTVCRGERALT